MDYPIVKSLLNYKTKTYLEDEVIGFSLPSEFDTFVDCALGINPFGYSKSITDEIIRKSYEGIGKYPSYPYDEFRDSVAAYYSELVSLERNQIVPSIGSMGILMRLNRFFIECGVHVLSNAPSFSSALSDIRASGGAIDFIKLDPNKNFKFCVDEFLDKISNKYTMVYLDNPNNPTGQVIPISEIEKIAKKCLECSCALVVDEAYGDFMKFENTAVSLVNKYENIFVCKSFSKGFGLPGLRVGYGVISSAFYKQIKKIPPEMVITDLSAQIAMVALKDYNHIISSRKKIKENKTIFLNSLKELRSSFTDSSVPIMMLYTEKDVDLFKLFLQHGILCESGEAYDYLDKRYIRLRIPKDIDELLVRIKKVEKSLSLKDK